jgi:hypothetical protein
MSSPNELSAEVWIGLARVVPREGNLALGESKGAFVNVLAKVASVEEFSSAVSKVLLENGFDITAIEDAEPLRFRLATHSIESDLEELAEDVLLTGETRFGTFFAFPNEH